MGIYRVGGRGLSVATVKTEGPVSVCATCRFAQWDKTANGRRHPNGAGRCTYQFPDGPLPKWLRERRFQRGTDAHVETLRELIEQRYMSRWIYWRDAHRIVAEPCPTWESAQADPAVAGTQG
jgi:hypothetical protein